MAYKDIIFRSPKEEKDFTSWVLQSPYNRMANPDMSAESPFWTSVYALFIADRRRRKRGAYASFSDVHSYLLRQIAGIPNDADREVNAAVKDYDAYNLSDKLFDVLVEHGNNRHPKAMCYLAIAEDKGLIWINEDHTPNPEHIFQVFQCAVERGYPLGWIYLARAYYAGYGVQKDPQLAKLCFHCAQLIQSPENLPQLAINYTLGDLCEKDLDKAEALLRKAIGFGGIQAKYLYGASVIRGTFPYSKDAIAWLKEAADAGHQDACYELGGLALAWAYAPQETEPTATDIADSHYNFSVARKYLLAAAHKGHEDAIYLLEQNKEYTLLDGTIAKFNIQEDERGKFPLWDSVREQATQAVQ